MQGIGRIRWNSDISIPLVFDEAAKKAANEKWEMVNTYITVNEKKIYELIEKKYPKYKILKLG